MTQPDSKTDPNAPYLTRPTTQTDLETRHKANYGAPVVNVDPNVTNAPYAVEDNDTSAYAGVDADKMTYANDTEKPLSGEGIEDQVAKEMSAGYAFGTDAQVEGKQTLGSGSSSPVVAVTTSGEAVKHEIVDRTKSNNEDSSSESDSAPRSTPRPLKAAAPKTSE